MTRKIIAYLETDTEDSIEEIAMDVIQEVSCCSHFIDTVKVFETKHGPFATCGDCASTTRFEEKGKNVILCDYTGHRMEPDFFCAYGCMEEETIA